MGRFGLSAKYFILPALVGMTSIILSSASDTSAKDSSPQYEHQDNALPRNRIPLTPSETNIPLRSQTDLNVIEERWVACQGAFQGRDPKHIQYVLDRLYDAKLDSGFQNMPDLAGLILRQGYRALAKGQNDVAMMLGRASKNIAPDSYPSSFFLSRSLFWGPDRAILDSLGYFWEGARLMVHHFLWGYYSLGNLLCISGMAIGALFCIFTIYLLLRYLKVFFHELTERVPRGLSMSILYGGVLFFMCLTFLFLPSLIWWAILVIFLTAPYHRQWERRFIAGCLLGSSVAPWIFLYSATFLLPLPKSVHGLLGCGQGNWNPDTERALVDSFLEDHEDVAVLWALALVHKRRGDYQRAEWFYHSAIDLDPDEARLWNNLGNLYYASDRFVDAKDAYNKAIALDPHLCAPHYNLSQILRREFLLSEGAEEFQKARNIDPKKVNYLLYIHAPHPNRLVIDEDPPIGMIWARCFRPSKGKALLADKLWNMFVGNIPLANSPLFFLCTSAGYILFSWWTQRGNLAFECHTCGAVVCSRCQPQMEQTSMCVPCYQALYQRDQIAREPRHMHLQKISRYRIKRQRRIRITSLFLPGIGHVLRDQGRKGFGYLLIFLLLVCWSAFGQRLLPSPMIAWENGSRMTKVLPIIGGLFFYLYVQRKLKKLSTS